MKRQNQNALERVSRLIVKANSMSARRVTLACMFYGAGHPDRWPILLALTAVPCLVSLIILPFMPESPRYLLVNKDNREAAEEGKV